MKKKNLIINYIVLSLIFFLSIGLFLFSILNKVNSSEIYKQNILKVVEIKVSDDEEAWGYATGFFIDNYGTILTNKHVVQNSKTNSNYNYVFARLADSKDWIRAEIKNVSENSDLASIKIEKSNTQYFNFADNVYNGEEIWTIGNPNNFGLSYTQGVVSSNLRIVNYNNTQIKTVQTSLVINEGNSGGPVFNKKGKLIGIISFRLKDKVGEVIQGVSFALTNDCIKEFLNV